MKRREFLAALSLGTAHVLLGSPKIRKGLPSIDPYQTVKLGRSGIETSLLGFGTGVSGFNRESFLTRQDAATSVDLLRHAYDEGVRFFDTADVYGTHSLMGEALKSMDRSKVTLASKIWFRKGGIPEPERYDADIIVDRFRKELGTDYIDLVQLHCAVNPEWPAQLEAQMEILDDLKSKGIIRAHGVSVHSLDAMKAAVNCPWVDVIHVRINPYGIAMDKPDPQEVVDVIRQLHESGKGVIGMKLVGNGKYQTESKRIDNALKFVMGLGCVDMMIVGFERKAQVNNYAQRITQNLSVIA